MSSTFDPYHHWLGIRPDEHPVDHYRLLGLVRFESDRDVISNACDRLMNHVRKHQTGPRGVHTQEVLTRLSAARTCLLNVAAKSTYDAVLQGQLAAAATGQRAAALAAAPAAVAPPPLPPPSATPPVPPPDFRSMSTGDRALHSASHTTRGSTARRSPPYVQLWLPALIVAGVLLVAVTVWGLGLLIGRAREEARRAPPVDNSPTTGTPTAEVDPSATDGAEDEPEVPPKNVVYIMQEAGGELNFSAGTATLAGNPRLSELEGQSVISGITSSDDRVRWNFRVEKPGPFRVEASYSAPPGSEGGTFSLSAGEQKTKPIAVRNTGEAGAFTEERVGFLWLRRSGTHELVLTPISFVEGQPLMTLKSLRLVPVQQRRRLKFLDIPATSRRRAL